MSKEKEEKTIEEKIFGTLDDWRHLPKYQLERRADIFFAIYLKEILKGCLDGNHEIDLIIPEFPLKNDETNHSSNVDYFCLANNNKAYFVELKTDIKSIDMKQYNRMNEMKDKGIEKLINEIKEITENSKQWEKYLYLFRQLNEGKIFEDKFSKIKDIKRKSEIKEAKIELNIKSKIEIECVYILPTKENEKEHENLKKLKEDKIKIITFDDIIEVLKNLHEKLHDLPEKDFLRKFIKSLGTWKNPVFYEEEKIQSRKSC